MDSPDPEDELNEADRERLQREKEEEQKSLAELAAKRDAALKRSKENPVKTVEADLSSDEDDMPVRQRYIPGDETSSSEEEIVLTYASDRRKRQKLDEQKNRDANVIELSSDDDKGSNSSDDLEITDYRHSSRRSRRTSSQSSKPKRQTKQQPVNISDDDDDDLLSGLNPSGENSLNQASRFSSHDQEKLMRLRSRKEMARHNRQNIKRMKNRNEEKQNQSYSSHSSYQDDVFVPKKIERKVRKRSPSPPPIPDQPTIKLKVRIVKDMSGREASKEAKTKVFKVFRNSLFSLILDHKALQPPVGSGLKLRLMFDGGPLPRNGTPEDEDMEDDDIVDAEWRK